MSEQSEGFDLSGKSLFIGLPAYDFKVSLKLAVSLAKLAQACQKHGIDIHIGSICGCSVVSRARNLLVQDFLESNADFLMFIDSDINFEPEDVLRLMAWGTSNGKDIVAGVPRTRSVEKVYICDLDIEDGNLIMDRFGLVRGIHVATAFMMIGRHVITSWMASNPGKTYYDKRTNRQVPCIFDFELTDEGYMGEDYLFCDRARALGFNVWIDPSIKLGHMGVQEYDGDFGSDILAPMIGQKLKEPDYDEQDG